MTVSVSAVRQRVAVSLRLPRPCRAPANSHLTDLQHHLFYLTYNGRAHICPIPKDKQLNRVLDVGTGTGIWAVDFGE